MTTDKKAKLIFIPFPTISHLIAAVKTAVLLADCDADLSISVLVMNPRRDPKITSVTSSSPNPRLTFVPLPHHQLGAAPTGKNFLLSFIESQKAAVLAAVVQIASESEKIAGFVLDMFCTPMMDVAEEFGSPSYIFFSSGAACLGHFLHIQGLKDEQNLNLNEFLDSDSAVSIPSFVNPVPGRVWPSSIFEVDGLIDVARDFRRTKGILVNSFLELENHAIQSFSDGENRNLPPVFPIGPILHSTGDDDGEIDDNRDAIVAWLDQQPDSSVVYLCFGTGGCFGRDQVIEIARALEKIVESGEIRFLWSLRKPPPEGAKMEFPGEYENPGEVLPEGFLERTVGVGRVIGWSPQMAVLSHAAVGGFVSHGGWNSTLESLWCGVPMAIWPMYAEQQLNAFQLVVELGMAVEVKMDYRRSSGVVVGAERVEAAVREVMKPGSEIREKVRALSEKSKEVLKEGGSSNEYLGRFIKRVFNSE